MLRPEGGSMAGETARPRWSLRFYCTTCLPGYHLPLVAAESNGLFADFNLDVDLLDPAGGPENVRQVAAGEADFCLTSVAHYLNARATFGDLGARFVAVVVQRCPMSGLVPDASPLRIPADLVGRRLGGPPDSGLVAEYQACMDRLGLGRSEVVPMDYLEAWAAVAAGDVEVVADFVDVLPRLTRATGVPMRAIPFGIEVYSSGLVAADRLSDAQVADMRDVLVAALERQRLHPDEGVDGFLRRYPETDRDAALEGWLTGVPNIFTDAPTGSMDAARWADTLEFYSHAHGLAPIDPGSAFRLVNLDVTVR
jgi:putative hydroxymethylpyrimidine transport system substrate-binding protein